MSVISERSSRTPRMIPNRQPRPRNINGGGRGYAHSEIGAPFIPRFSAAASEGVKVTMPGDEWGDNTTCVTGNTSDHSFSGDEPKVYEAPVGRVAARRCSRLLWLCLASILSTVALLSAPIMVALPLVIHHVGFEWPKIECEVDCQGQIMQLCFKTILLLLALWALYWRRAAADMPRLYFARAAFALFVLFILFAFWLFYIVRIFFERHRNYSYIVAFALSLLDALMYTHYISLIILEIRAMRPEFTISIVRDPDGHSGSMSLGVMSMQEAAIAILRHHESTFPAFNGMLDKARQSHGRMRGNGNSGIGAGFKMYDIEGLGAGDSLNAISARTLMEVASRRRNTGHAEILQEEMDFERRMKKRKYRLIAAAEDAFSHFQGIAGNQTNAGKTLAPPMDSVTAAQGVFTYIMKPLNKYLRLTKQQKKHPADKVTDYIARCLSLKLSHRTFLQRFFNERLPTTDIVTEAKWSIVADEQASVDITHGMSFLLRSHNREDDAGVQLLCTVNSLPFFNLTEQSRASISKFALKISSESSV